MRSARYSSNSAGHVRADLVAGPLKEGWSARPQPAYMSIVPSPRVWERIKRRSPATMTAIPAPAT